MILADLNCILQIVWLTLTFVKQVRAICRNLQREGGGGGGCELEVFKKEGVQKWNVKNFVW